MTAGLPAPGAGYRVWHATALRLAGDVRTTGGTSDEETGTAAAPLRALKAALLATYTTDILAELLPVAAARHRMQLNLRTAPFGQLEQMLLDPGSPILSDRPDYIVLGCAWQDLGLLPSAACLPGSVEVSAEGRVEAAVERMTTLWGAAARAGVRVVQLGLVPPASDPAGAASWTAPRAVSAMVRQVNAELHRRVGEHVLFIDVERQAAVVGLSRWEDPRGWYSMRQPFAIDAAPYLAALVAGTIAYDAGLARRCVVLDLDGTLWDGVLGDDGIEGIEHVHGPRGEAFLAFQQYLCGLRARGIILAVASKNDRELVLRALAERPGMLLRQKDFAVIVADWRPKSVQIREIAERLRLGFDSLVFVDDNPAERAEVAVALPGVEVVDLPGQPSGYPAALEATPGLYAGALLAEDIARAESYAALAAAGPVAAEDGIEGHLRRMAMTAEIAPVGERTLARVAQLVGKTNQFNSTTRRRTLNELILLFDSAHWHCLTLRLRDAFADHGVVGVVIIEFRGRVAEIDSLILSCRVIGRTAERSLVAAASRWARDAGCMQLVGLREPTERNGVTADVYPNLGFSADPAHPGRFAWDLGTGVVTPSPFIHEEPRR